MSISETAGCKRVGGNSRMPETGHEGSRRKSSIAPTGRRGLGPTAPGEAFRMAMVQPIRR